MSSKIAKEIITLNIRENFVHFLQNFCEMKKVGDKEFVEEIRNTLLKDFSKSEPVSKLSETPFTELPKYVFNNRSSTKYRQVKTINGFQFDVVKSAMQKYGRRGFPQKCLYSMIEMNFFKWLDGGKSSFTNFYNRVRVVLLEDIGIASPHMIPVANEWLKILKTTKDPFPEVLIKLAWCVSNNLHVRLFSHLRTYYSLNKPKMSDILIDFPLGRDKENFGDLVGALLSDLESRNTSCVWWMSEIVNSPHKLQVRRYRSSRPGFLVFYVLEKFFEEKKVSPLIMENFKICLEWYKELKIKESIMCPFHPMFLYIFQNKLDFTQKPVEMKIDNKMHYFQTNLLNRPVEFINSIYDIHTKIGRRKGKNTADFAVEGSLVGFEDYELDQELARNEYINNKIRLGNVSKESGVFKLKVRAQLTCSKSRPDVYFATDSEGKNIVVKGPYLNYYEANKSFQVSRILSLFDKVNVVPTNMKLLIPDMFKNVPVGCRRKIKPGNAYYFLVFDDLYDLDEYPMKSKSSKLWKDENVVDFGKLFSKHDFGFAVPSEMSVKGKISLIYQLGIRYIFELGDFASRNFTRVGDVVYNLDTEGMFVGKSLRWKKTERELLARIYRENKEEILKVFESWSNVSSVSNPSFYDRWYMIRRIMNLSEARISKVMKNLEFIKGHFEEWLLA